MAGPATSTSTVTQRAPAAAPRPRPAAPKKTSTAFLWEARTKQGETRKGEMEANDAEAVNNRLKSLGLAPVKVKKKPYEITIKIPGFGGVASKDILIFTRQFATMIDAGLPLVQCLDILATQMDNAAFKTVVFAIKTRVEGGSTFADALKDHPKVFDELYIQLCAAGEVGGILDTILNRLAAYAEKNEKLKRKVKGAMIYPAIVLIVAVGVTALLLLKVTPVFEKMFSDFGSALPAPTQFVVDLSKFLQAYIIHMVVGIIAFVVAVTVTYRNPAGRRLIDRGSLKAPIIGDVHPQGGGRAVHPDAGDDDQLGRADPRRARRDREDRRQPDHRRGHLLRPRQDLRGQEHRRPAARDQGVPADGGADDRRRRGDRRHGRDAQQDRRLLRRRGRHRDRRA